MEPPKQGRYEVRHETRLGVPVLGIYWIAPGEPPMLLTVVAPERAPLLAEALNSHLQGKLGPKR
jgi:hypothetical protein